MMDELERAKRALIAADKSGDVASAQRLAKFIRESQPQQEGLMPQLQSREKSYYALKK